MRPSKAGFAVDSRTWNYLLRLRNKIAEIDAKSPMTLTFDDEYNQYGNWLRRETHTVRGTVDSHFDHLRFQGQWDRMKREVAAEWYAYIDGFVGSDQEYQIAAIQFFDRYLVLP